LGESVTVDTKTKSPTTAFVNLQCGGGKGFVITLLHAAMAIAGEVSVRVRAKSMAIGFTFNYFSTAWDVPMPYLYNTTEANLGGKVGWILAGMGVIALGTIFSSRSTRQRAGHSRSWTRCSMDEIINAPRLSRCASLVRSDVGIYDIAHIYTSRL
jgi:hypothetical protein